MKVYVTFVFLWAESKYLRNNRHKNIIPFSVPLCVPYTAGFFQNTHTHTHRALVPLPRLQWLSPRSEHCTTRCWHWHPKGHVGNSGMSPTVGSKADPSSSSLIIVITPPISPSIPKSQKPLCSKGRAKQREDMKVAHSSRSGSSFFSMAGAARVYLHRGTCRAATVSTVTKCQQFLHDVFSLQALQTHFHCS